MSHFRSGYLHLSEPQVRTAETAPLTRLTSDAHDAAEIALDALARLQALDAAICSEVLATFAIRRLRERAAIKASLAVLNAPLVAVSAVSLPANSVAMIAKICGGTSSFMWCATCKDFHSAQPRLRGLFVGEPCDQEVMEGASRALHGHFVVHASFGNGGKAHRGLDSISDRHCAEITHLVINAWRNSEEPVLDIARLQQHGRRFSALKVLALKHSTRGFHDNTAGNGEPGLDACSAAFVLNTAATLQTLCLYNTDQVIRLKVTLPDDEMASGMLYFVLHMARDSDLHLPDDNYEILLELIRRFVGSCFINLCQPPFVIGRQRFFPHQQNAAAMRLWRDLEAHHNVTWYQQAMSVPEIGM